MRETPTRKDVTIYLAHGRWFMRESAAYYEIAKKLVAKKYPRWLDDNDLDVVVTTGECAGDTVGDVNADVDGITNWRARRERRHELFWRFASSSYDPENYEGFDQEKWQRFVRRVARFLMFVDRRRAELRSRRDELQRELADVETRLAAWQAAAGAS